ncbi:MAG: 4Fe-4S dicluster domain-containing protein [Firmicutes bacterium]|nr:4Fe-4S dicluster domain-containing protein [Bacillota bacterium]
MKHTYLKDVATLSYATEKCIGCGKCIEVCPHGVFHMDGGKAQIVQKDLCMECGACALNCPAKALDVSAGVGCAAAVIMGWFRGKEPVCGCGEDGGCC